MVAEGGDCLLDFVACNPVFSAYKIMSSTEKWAPYMKDVDKYISPLHFCNNPGEEVNRSMSNAGFKSYNVQVKERSFVYKGTQIMRGELLNCNYCFTLLTLDVRFTFKIATGRTRQDSLGSPQKVALAS